MKPFALAFCLFLPACGSTPPPAVKPAKGDAGPSADRAGMVQIPAGTFAMGHAPAKFGAYGSDFKENEFPQHTVTLKAYAIDRDEVTVAQYAAFLDAYRDPNRFDRFQPIAIDNGRYTPLGGFERQPIAFVSWLDAATYCAFAGKALPTEAQWERAAKGPGPANPRFPWGDDGPTCAQAVFLSSSACERTPVPVGSRSPAGDSNEGLHDLAGNVAEWNADFYDRYTPDEATDPAGPDNADGSLTMRVMRGGGFRDPGAAIRTTARWGADPTGRSEEVGFRCACTL